MYGETVSPTVRREESRNQEVEMQIIPIIYSAPLPHCSTLENFCYTIAEVFLPCCYEYTSLGFQHRQKSS